MSEAPVVVAVNQAGMAASRYYGPFPSLNEAEQWIAGQPEGVRFSIILLRSPNLRRTYDDFYNPRFDFPELDGESGDIVYHV